MDSIELFVGEYMLLNGKPSVGRRYRSVLSRVVFIAIVINYVLG